MAPVRPGPPPVVRAVPGRGGPLDPLRAGRGGRGPPPGRPGGRQRLGAGGGEGLEAPRAGLRSAVAGQQAVPEEEADSGRAPARGGVQGPGDIGGRVRSDGAQGQLGAGDDHRVVEAGQGVGQRGRGVGHGVGAVENDVAPRALRASRVPRACGALRARGRARGVVRAQVVNDRLPRLRGGVGGIDKRVESGQRHPPLKVGAFEERGEPMVEIGAGHEPVGGADHSDGAAGVGDMDARCGRSGCSGRVGRVGRVGHGGHGVPPWSSERVRSGASRPVG